ncbi:MFS transporter [Nesterenkonia natronophila]|uniref:MFS transporter n=1 Tax=Nesterenkonia natronophila TaxID=2174932 RepID=UPI001CEF6BB6|nr:MFS transporter [Nesterenkonia natronophila]
MKSTSAGPTFPFRDVVLGALIPAFIFSTGIGALLPIIAPYSVERGATLATAGVVAAMLPVGQILADLPAGQLAAKIGDRPAMLFAGCVAALGFLGAALAPSVVTLAVAVLLVGASNAVFHLARHSYLTAVTPAGNRATVLSTLGGVHRIGQFVGPFLGAGVIHFFAMSAVFYLAVVTALAATVTVWLARPPQEEKYDSTDQSVSQEITKPRFWRVLGDHRGMLATLGAVGMMVGAIRGARQQVIPLWGQYIELDPTTISLLFGLAGGIDMLLFYPAGRVMDRWGRLWVGVPAMTMLGIAMALFPLTSNATGLALVAMLLGFANGWGSGIMMTISSDISPPEARPQFLGAWRLLTDIGLGSGPLILAAGAALGSLAGGVWVASSVGPLAAAGMQRWLPRYSDHANRTTRRRAGLVD